MPSASNKVALITGANKGIGFEVTRQLGKAGCTVLLGARNPDLGREAASSLQKDNLDVRFVELDLARPETIQNTAVSLANELQQLDILVNNAGIAVQGSDGPPSVANLEAVQRIMQTNFRGALAVTQAILPLLRKSPAGRIVNVSSELGSLTLQSDPNWEFAPVKLIGYCASKAAMNMFTSAVG
jgi:NAD(P)-dependent dehydrogenase (short-subunit alcohol dehydrogenase family)